MKGFINIITLIYFNMKLNKNEKFVMKILLENPELGSREIGTKLNITSQAVGKIKKQLTSKGIIKNNELAIDYEKLGVKMHAIALIKIHPSKLNKSKLIELREKVLSPINAIRSYAIPQTDVTHIIIYAFRDIKEYDDYFKKIKKEFEEIVEIKNSYVFSSGSIIKSSPKELFLKIINELD